MTKMLKTAALAGLLGLGLAAVLTTPAQAERSTVRCDRDGNRWGVSCDWDDCRRVPVRAAWHQERRYYDNDRDRFYRYHHFDHRRGEWVCDGSSEYCRWSMRDR